MTFYVARYGITIHSRLRIPDYEENAVIKFVDIYEWNKAFLINAISKGNDLNVIKYVDIYEWNRSFVISLRCEYQRRGNAHIHVLLWL